MQELSARRIGRAGRITLTRPQALNALNPPMCRALDDALIAWADDPEVSLVVIDAEGERAFCAGGDIARVHAEGSRGDYEGTRRFWREEYRMNLRLGTYPKPVVSLMQGFTMGGGVGIGCHVSHRVVGETLQLAMPECAIGLVPDVGGTHLLANAPAGLGEYLGLTGARMGPGDAILAGFADSFVPEADWPALIAALEETGDIDTLVPRARAAPGAPLAAQREVAARLFSGPTVTAIRAGLEGAEGDLAAAARKAMDRNSPLAMTCTLALIRAARAAPDLARALAAEYRFTWRSLPDAEFLEGIRAAVIDKDRSPRWRITGAEAEAAVSRFLAPLGLEELTF